MKMWKFNLLKLVLANAVLVFCLGGHAVAEEPQKCLNLEQAYNDSKNDNFAGTRYTALDFEVVGNKKLAAHEGIVTEIGNLRRMNTRYSQSVPEAASLIAPQAWMNFLFPSSKGVLGGKVISIRQIGCKALIVDREGSGQFIYSIKEATPNKLLLSAKYPGSEPITIDYDAKNRVYVSTVESDAGELGCSNIDSVKHKRKVRTTGAISFVPITEKPHMDQLFQESVLRALEEPNCVDPNPGATDDEQQRPKKKLQDGGGTGSGGKAEAKGKVAS